MNQKHYLSFSNSVVYWNRILLVSFPIVFISFLFCSFIMSLMPFFWNVMNLFEQNLFFITILYQIVFSIHINLTNSNISFKIYRVNEIFNYSKKIDTLVIIFYLFYSFIFILCMFSVFISTSKMTFFQMVMKSVKKKKTKNKAKN